MPPISTALRRLPGEPVDQHAHVGARAAHVRDQRVAGPGEERGPADAVGRPAADREDRVAESLIQAHQRAVVLREERRRPQLVRGQRVVHRDGHVAGHPGQRAVQDRGVLPLQQAQRADLVAERDVDLAQLTLDDLAGFQFVPRRDGGENAGDRHPVGGAGDLAEEPRDRVGVQRGQVPPVELDATVDDHRAGRDRGGEVRRPAEHGPDAVRGGPADPDDRDPAQLPALQHGVRRVGGAQHDVGDPLRVRFRCAEHGVDRGRDPAGDVRRAGHLGLGDHPVGPVHDHGVGVGAADVDAEAAVRSAHRRAPPRARSRRRSRTPGAR